MPAHPTWQQVAELAAKVDGAQPGMKGICLRGLPGWGELMAPLTTVVNTFGGTWFDQGLEGRRSTRPEFKKATKFYVDLVQRTVRRAPPQAGFTECLNELSQGKVAMWYDATSAAGSLEAAARRSRARSATCRRRSRRPRPPAGSTPGRGACQKATKNADDAWKFISWASSKEYEKLVGDEARLVQRPGRQAGLARTRTRTTGRRPPPSQQTQEAIEAADPHDPGVQPRPDARHPVRRHPGVHRPRHQGVPGDQRGHRRTHDRRRGPEEGPEARRRSRRLPRSDAPATGRCGPPTPTGHPCSSLTRRSGTAPPEPAAIAPHRPTSRPLECPRQRAPGPAAARPGLHDRGDPAAVRGHAGDLLLRLERALPRQAHDFTGLDNYARCLTDARLRHSVWTRSC